MFVVVAVGLVRYASRKLLDCTVVAFFVYSPLDLLPCPMYDAPAVAKRFPIIRSFSNT